MIGTELSYGKNNTRESRMKELGLSEEEVTKLALPLLRYELLVDQVLKSDKALPGKLVLEFIEAPEAIDVFPWLVEQRKGQHIFFLTGMTTAPRL